MEKLVTQIRPKEDIDLDKFWQEWGEKYAACYVGKHGLTRYIISRFQKGHMREISLKDDPTCLWGMEEFWFEDTASYQKMQQVLLEDHKTKTLLEEFQSQLAWKWAGWVEERVIVDSGYTELVREGKDLVKMLVTFRLAEGKNSDDGWKLWIIGHSQDHLHTGVRKYTLNRVKKVIEGEVNKVWGIPEVWYSSREACDFDHEQGFAFIRNHPEQKQIFEDFHRYTTGNWGAFVEEKVIIF
jgi:hypothetical protein